MFSYVRSVVQDSYLAASRRILAGFHAKFISSLTPWKKQTIDFFIVRYHRTTTALLHLPDFRCGWQLFELVHGEHGLYVGHQVFVHHERSAIPGGALPWNLALISATSRCCRSEALQVGAGGHRFVPGSSQLLDECHLEALLRSLDSRVVWATVGCGGVLRPKANSVRHTWRVPGIKTGNRSSCSFPHGLDNMFRRR